MAFFKVPTNPNIFETPDFSSRPFVSGFELAVTGLTTLSIQPGCARAVANPFNVFYPPINANAPGVITVDVSSVFAPSGLDANGNVIVGTAVGFGGCFPLPLNQVGLAGNNTVFPLFAIGDSSGKNFTTIIVPTSGQFLPAGYDSFVRVGQVFINGSTFNIIPVSQTGHYELREYMLADDILVLSAGTATVPTLVDLSINGGPIVPNSTSSVKLNIEFTPNAAGDSVSLNPVGLTSSSYPVFIQNPGAARMSVQVSMNPGIDVTSGDAGVNYLNSTASASTDIYVGGWTDDMAVQLR